jgi:hypothetical protein
LLRINPLEALPKVKKPIAAITAKTEIASAYEVETTL